MKRRFVFRVIGFFLFLSIITVAESKAQIVILPLHQFELKAFLRGSNVELKWIAENEMDTKRFVIERSLDGSTYSGIATKPVNGPLNVTTEYQHPDEISGLLSGNVIYYRIKAEDNVNRYGFSNVVPVRLSKINGAQVWPNPFVSMVNVSYNAAINSKIGIALMDNKGQILQQSEHRVYKGINQVGLGGLGELTGGIYYVRITDLNTNVSFIQVVIK